METACSVGCHLHTIKLHTPNLRMFPCASPCVDATSFHPVFAERFILEADRPNYVDAMSVAGVYGDEL